MSFLPTGLRTKSSLGCVRYVLIGVNPINPGNVKQQMLSSERKCCVHSSTVIEPLPVLEIELSLLLKAKVKLFMTVLNGLLYRFFILSINGLQLEIVTTTNNHY